MQIKNFNWQLGSWWWLKRILRSNQHESATIVYFLFIFFTIVLWYKFLYTEIWYFDLIYYPNNAYKNHLAQMFCFEFLLWNMLTDFVVSCNVSLSSFFVLCIFPNVVLYWRWSYHRSTKFFIFFFTLFVGNSFPF